TPIKDSIKSLEKITDSSGLATFQLLNGGLYKIKISSVNYAAIEKNITATTSNSNYTFTLEAVSKTLNNVVVTANRPLIRQEDDKTIVDPESLAASSTNAYEIMEKTPGLFVDQDGNIYLSSTTPATIYINGREQKMSTSDIATMLKSLPPNSIASIEILRTPSAKYDASGGGGIVNVVLRKGVRIGLTGSVTVGGNKGKYANGFAGVNINNNNGKVTTYLNVQYSKRNSYEQIKTDRIFSADSILSQNAFTKYPATSYYAGYGVSYSITKKWDLSYDGRLSVNESKNNSTNNSIISKLSTKEVTTQNEAIVQNKGNSYNINQAVTAKFKVDTLGSEWTTDISYTFAPNKTNQLFTTTFFLPQNAKATGNGTIQNKLHFFSAQTNLSKKLSGKITVETGLKTTNVSFDNSTVYTRKSSFQYTENINSAYLQASKNISGIIVKLGSRLENTNMDGQQKTPYDTSFRLHRTDLFPYVYISRNIMKIAGFDLRAYLVYRRTINRPAYEYLNPFPRIVDQYLFETGNPSLRPQFTKNYEANISVDERPIFAVGINDTKDIFTQVVYQADSSRSIAYRTYDNLGSNKETYFRVLGAIPPGKVYFFVAGAQYNHNFYQGLYESKPLSFKKGSWSVFTYHNLKLTKTTQLSLNGFYRFNGQLQFYELSSFGALNFSVNQQMLNKKLTVTLSAQDIFFTNNNEFTLKQGSVNASGIRKGDTRRFGINLRYNFGFRKKEESNLFNVESPEKAN
ncbi:MAG TPA: outer membrane beta-barrel protein, partial [Chitinophagaceae bacterium]|nr:outer membrane beta-barrel protein [Chitinophagaceae bacterium]